MSKTYTAASPVGVQRITPEQVAYRAGLEAAAKVCDERAAGQYMRSWEDMSEGFTRADEDKACAAAIMALADNGQERGT
jgi:hypothetical protein